MLLFFFFSLSLLTCVVGAFSSAEVVWFSCNTSCGSQRHLSVPSFLLRSKTADLEDLPPAAPPAAGLAPLPCVLSLNIDMVDLLYLLFLPCPNRPPGAWRLSPRSPAPRRRVAVVVASCSSAVPRVPVLGAPPLPPSLSAQPLDLSPCPDETRVAPPLARACVYRR